MQDKPCGQLQTAIDRLKCLLKAQLDNPPQDPSEIQNIFLNFQSTENAETVVTKLLEDEIVIELLIYNCDEPKNKGFFKSLYPLLYSWIQANTRASLKLVCQFTPTLIWHYLASVATDSTDDEVETCLVHLTNILSRKSRFSFRLPSIHMISIYHHPSRLQYNGGLTEASLTKGFNMEPVYTQPGITEYSNITSSNRLSILSKLLEKYNQDIGDVINVGLERLCWLCMWLCASGMPSSVKPSGDLRCWGLSRIRYSVDKDILSALLTGLQYCLYNGHSVMAQKALTVVALRAEYEVLPQVIMMAASLQDLLNIAAVSPASKPFGIPMPQLQGTINDTSLRPVRSSFIRHEDIMQLRRRISSNEIREDSEERTSPASAVIDVEDSDESDIHIACFRGGKLQN